MNYPCPRCGYEKYFRLCSDMVRCQACGFQWGYPIKINLKDLKNLSELEQDQCLHKIAQDASDHLVTVEYNDGKNKSFRVKFCGAEDYFHCITLDNALKAAAALRKAYESGQDHTKDKFRKKLGLD